jgi:hypothetical protein
MIAIEVAIVPCTAQVDPLMPSETPLLRRMSRLEQGLLQQELA